MVAGGVAGGLADQVSLGVLASWVPADAVGDAVAVTGKGARRAGGKLPPHVVVYFVMAGGPGWRVPVSPGFLAR